MTTLLAPDLVLSLLDGPWGPVRIAAGDAGVVAVSMLAAPETFAADLDRRHRGSLVPVADAHPGPARDLAIETASRIAALLAGAPVDVVDLPVDLTDRPAWDRLVLDGVRSIPRGEVASYGEVARRIGRPGAARAVGGAVGRNPISLLVPAHRVIAGDGSLGGYGVDAWGSRAAALELKRALLALEGLSIPGV